MNNNQNTQRSSRNGSSSPPPLEPASQHRATSPMMLEVWVQTSPLSQYPQLTPQRSQVNYLNATISRLEVEICEQRNIIKGLVERKQEQQQQIDNNQPQQIVEDQPTEQQEQQLQQFEQPLQQPQLLPCVEEQQINSEANTKVELVEHNISEPRTTAESVNYIIIANNDGVNAMEIDEDEYNNDNDENTCRMEICLPEAENVQTEIAQTENAQTGNAPADNAPVENAPAENAPTENAPAEIDFDNESPEIQAAYTLKYMSNKEISHATVPSENAPTENASTENASTENVPTETAPADNAPTENISTENTPTENAQGENFRFGNANVFDDEMPSTSAQAYANNAMPLIATNFYVDAMRRLKEGLDHQYQERKQRQQEQERQQQVQNDAKIARRKFLEDTLINPKSDSDTDPNFEYFRDYLNQGPAPEVPHLCYYDRQFLIPVAEQDPELEAKGTLVSLGSNRTTITIEQYESINWSSYSDAIRKLLEFKFTREILATHSMTGRPSPAFLGQNKPVKQALTKSVVEDIVNCVMHKCKVPLKLVRNAITTKLADETKMKRQRDAKARVPRSCRNNQHEENN